jgi:hypothetical protein
MFWGIWDAEKENLVLPAGKKKDALTLAFHPKAQVKKYTPAGLLACFYAPSRIPRGPVVLLQKIGGFSDFRIEGFFVVQKIRQFINSSIRQSETYSYGDSAGFSPDFQG